ncbi:hypothetical protein BCR32DRAFT_275776 [Anaeromyces robustus]|uniref:Uncharacterized protein n=1 Tax=Anaeromyces robustus TaxID=1754192 RepID=A0A1Y1XJM7_9FUNG|nr:hypothetical protein BCR32DRAFT_275776 [Anaeromyces robustus]|eukprot:ORX85959.1 hypothetical protein BCR32DRAFT_275776 [Anaeromyces robustus]
MINNSCPNCSNYCSCCFHCDSYQRIDHCLVVTSDNSSVDNRINNIVKGYKSSDNIRINSVSNIDILENRKIVNRYRIYIFLIGGRKYNSSERINNCPYKKEWKCSFLSVRLSLVHIQNLHSCCDLCGSIE